MTAAASSIVAGHEAFRAMLLALAHPGRPFAYGASATPEELLSAVYERDTPVWRSAGWHEDFGRPVPVGDARLLLIAGSGSDGALLHADRGSEEQPERAATAIYRGERDGPRTAARLSGPGVDGVLVAELPLSHGELIDRAEACRVFPLGVDVLVLADEFVTGLPRTTAVELQG